MSDIVNYSQLAWHEVERIPEDLTLTQFWNLLDSWDWFYEMSDDHQVWRRGTVADAKLRAFLNWHKEKTGRVEFEQMYNGFVAHHYSGEAWNTPKATKPEMPA